MRSGFIRLEPFASVSHVICRDEIVQVTDSGQHMLWYQKLVPLFRLFACLFQNHYNTFTILKNNGKLNLKKDKIKPHHKQRFL